MTAGRTAADRAASGSAASPGPGPTCLEDVARLARAVLPPDVWGYVAAGAGDETTVRANREAVRRIRLRPRVLVDVSRCDTATTLLGTTVAAPIGVAPMAYHRLAHPDGEAGMARAAGAEGVPLVVATFSSQTLEDVATATSGPLWFQVYCFRDRSVTEGLLRRAETAGYRAVVLTVDAPRMGARRRDVRSGFALPPHVVAANLAASGPDTGHARRMGRSALADHARELVDPSLTWRDVAWLRSVTGLPLVLKGIMTGEDAALAAEAGAEAVLVSNHGGRQLDGVAGTLDVLPEVVAAAGDRCEVYVDGGLRGGGDVLKALALGARAAFLGRPVLWGLAVDGEAGARTVLRMVKEELELSMVLCGCPAIERIGPSLVWRGATGGRAT